MDLNLDPIPPSAQPDSIAESDSPDIEDSEPSGAHSHRHSISSLGSNYDIASEDDVARDNEPIATADEAASTLLRNPPKRPRPAHTESQHRLLKRNRTNFTPAYLELLNDDIRDAASRVIAHPADVSGLEATRLGLTEWSVPEKELFYEALNRLGPDRPVDIAARIRTKNEVEVAAYLHLLESQTRERKQQGKLKHVVQEEIPAAIELSQACCTVLEEGADEISLRQEGYEETEERKAWGEEYWLIGQGNRKQVEADPPKGLGEAIGLFKTQNWLNMSERVFMNGGDEEYNWNSVSEEMPTIWATALDDFYALAVSLTRKMVASTIYFADSASRTNLNEDRPGRIPSREVERHHVEAAILSLGLTINGKKFWAQCARRLRLNVIDHKGREREYRDDHPTMEYCEVEKQLGFYDPHSGPTNSSDDERGPASPPDTPPIDESEDAEDETTASDDSEEHEDDDKEGDNPIPGVNEAAVQLEAKELLKYSALDYPKTTRARRKLVARLRIAHAHELSANSMDARASDAEERRLWAMMGRTPPNLTKPGQAKLQRPNSSHPVDDLIYTRTAGGGGWRDNLGFVPSRWEMDALP